MHRKIGWFIMLLLAAGWLSGCATTTKPTSTPTVQTCKHVKGKTCKSYYQNGKKYSVLSSSRNYEAKGVASWYGRQFNHKHTSSGERFNMYQLTAAHKTLPLSTYVLVTNLRNGRHVIVKINDRGPFVGNRLIDVSYEAAKKLGMLAMGTAPVEIKVVKHSA